MSGKAVPFSGLNGYDLCGNNSGASCNSMKDSNIQKGFVNKDMSQKFVNKDMFQKEENKLSTTEVNDQKKTVLELKNQLSKLFKLNEADDQKKTILELRSQLSDLKIKNQELTNKNQELTNKNQELADENADLFTDMNKISTNYMGLSRKVNQYETTNSELIKECQNNIQKVRELESQNEELNSQQQKKNKEYKKEIQVVARNFLISAGYTNITVRKFSVVYILALIFQCISFCQRYINKIHAIIKLNQEFDTFRRSLDSQDYMDKESMVPIGSELTAGQIFNDLDNFLPNCDDRELIMKYTFIYYQLLNLHDHEIDSNRTKFYKNSSFCCDSLKTKIERLNTKKECSDRIDAFKNPFLSNSNEHCPAYIISNENNENELNTNGTK